MSAVRLEQVTVVLVLLLMQPPLADTSWTQHVLHSLHSMLFSGSGDSPNAAGDSPVSPPVPQVMWGIPDMETSAGKLFRFTVPSHAFTADVTNYQVTLAGQSGLPDWMYYNETNHVLYGVPDTSHLGNILLQVTGYCQPSTSDGQESSATTTFLLTVTPASLLNPAWSSSEVKTPTGLNIGPCDWDETIVRASLILDVNIEDLTPKQKVAVLYKSAQFMQKKVSMFNLIARRSQAIQKLLDTSVMVAGPGNSEINSKNSGAELSWIISCGDSEVESDVSKILSHNIDTGRITAELGYHIQGWYLSETLPPEHIRKIRLRRQAGQYKTPVHTPSLYPSATRTETSTSSSSVSIPSHSSSISSSQSITVSSISVSATASPHISSTMISPSMLSPSDIMPSSILPTPTYTTESVDLSQSQSSLHQTTVTLLSPSESITTISSLSPQATIPLETTSLLTVSTSDSGITPSLSTVHVLDSSSEPPPTSDMLASPSLSSSSLIIDDSTASEPLTPNIMPSSSITSSPDLFASSSQVVQSPAPEVISSSVNIAPSSSDISPEATVTITETITGDPTVTDQFPTSVNLDVTANLTEEVTTAATVTGEQVTDSVDEVNTTTISEESATDTGVDGSTVPGPEGTTVPGPEGTTVPGPEGTTVPGAEGTTVPGAEGTTVPGAEGTTVPGAEGTTVPGAEGTTVPGAEGTTVPGAEGTTVPGAEGTTVPGAEGTTVPGAEGTTIPGAEGTTVPGAEGTTVQGPEGSTIQGAILEGTTAPNGGLTEAAITAAGSTGEPATPLTGAMTTGLLTRDAETTGAEILGETTPAEEGITTAIVIEEVVTTANTDGSEQVTTAVSEGLTTELPIEVATEVVVTGQTTNTVVTGEPTVAGQTTAAATELAPGTTIEEIPEQTTAAVPPEEVTATASVGETTAGAVDVVTGVTATEQATGAAVPAQTTSGVAVEQTTVPAQTTAGVEQTTAAVVPEAPVTAVTSAVILDVGTYTVPVTTITANTNPSTSMPSPSDVPLNEDTRAPPDRRPIRVNPILRVSTSLGTPFTFHVPHDTFYDYEDGGTPNLTLSLRHGEHSVSNHSFVQLHATQQVLYGIPLSHDLAPLRLHLVATDSKGQEVIDTFNVYINTAFLDDLSFVFIMTFDLDFSEFTESRYLVLSLVSRIAGYYGDDPRYYSVSSINNGSVVVHLTDNRISKSECERERISAMFDKIYSDGDIDTAFRQKLLPEFPISNVSVEYRGVCVADLYENTTTEYMTVIVDNTGGGRGVNVILATVIPVLIFLIALFIFLLFYFFCLRRRFKHRITRSDQSSASSYSLPDDEKPIYSNNRKPVLLASELELNDVGKPRKPLVLDSDVPAARAYDNPGYAPCERPAPPPYALPQGDVTAPEWDLSDGLPCEGPGSPEGAHPPAYRLPPPYYGLMEGAAGTS